MVPALAPPSAQVAGHQIVGASTGYMTGDYGNWDVLVERALAVSTLAVELSALAEPELPGLVDFVCRNTGLPFVFVSVHAPTKAKRAPDAEVVAFLARLAAFVDAIVIHPDTVDDMAAYRSLGSKVVVENMDRRKPSGQTADDLDVIFEALPEAGLCLDVAHAASVDATLAVAHRILDRHGSRLRHVHVSSLDAACHRQPLTEADEQAFTPLLDRCRDVPWILEAPARA